MILPITDEDLGKQTRTLTYAEFDEKLARARETGYAIGKEHGYRLGRMDAIIEQGTKKAEGNSVCVTCWQFEAEINSDFCAICRPLTLSDEQEARLDILESEFIRDI